MYYIPILIKMLLLIRDVDELCDYLTRLVIAWGWIMSESNANFRLIPWLLEAEESSSSKLKLVPVSTGK